MVADFLSKGWAVFAPEPAVTQWAAHAKCDAKRALQDPGLAHWYACKNTWFVGLDALSNDAQGRVAGSEPLSGAIVDFIASQCGGWPALHAGQVSGVFPGYPRPREGETEAGFRYRLNRDAAHVDGVIGVGHPKRRFVKEPHAFILGIPLTQADADAAPLVVWEGSHLIMQDAFRRVFESHAGDPSKLDVTRVYQDARKRAFETCERVEVHGLPGSAFVLHRMALHGVAPWKEGAKAAPEGRLIAYFRPPMPGGATAWVADL
ncbi:MAG: hypothetical protein AB8B47_12300 [Roseobacter sp.]